MPDDEAERDAARKICNVLRVPSNYSSLVDFGVKLDSEIAKILPYIQESNARLRAELFAKGEEIALLKACNQSQHELTERVWRALEPTGEYEGELNLVEFAQSTRERAEQAERTVAELRERLDAALASKVE